MSKRLVLSMFAMFAFVLLIVAALSGCGSNQASSELELASHDSAPVNLSEEEVENKGEVEKFKSENIKNEKTKSEKAKDGEAKPKKENAKDDVNKLNKKEIKKSDSEKHEYKKKEPKKEDEKKGPEREKVKVTEISGDYMSEVELNIRSSHGLNHKVIGVLKPYEKAIATAKATYDGITWYKIKYGSVEGWASANYLKPYKKGAKLKATPKANNNTRSENKSSSQSYKANHIYFNGKAVPYQNIGNSDSSDGTKGRAQHVIDTTNNAATWGGAATFSGTDGMNTHFIGHNPGQFSGMHTADTFIVTDSKGNAFTYKKTALYVVDEKGIRVSDGVSKWDRIVGTGGGERITLQSTKKHPLKYIVEAELVK